MSEDTMPDALAGVLTFPQFFKVFGGGAKVSDWPCLTLAHDRPVVVAKPGPSFGPFMFKVREHFTGHGHDRFPRGRAP